MIKRKCVFKFEITWAIKKNKAIITSTKRNKIPMSVSLMVFQCHYLIFFTDTVNAQILKFSIGDFFSKYDKIRRLHRIWKYLLKKSFNSKLHFFCSALNFLFEELFCKFYFLVIFGPKEKEWASPANSAYSKWV